MQIEYSREECADITACLEREWLVTNGLGGYASGTIACVNTRRYHGLLMAAIKPPVERTALLLRLNEAVDIDGETTELMTSEFGDGTISPAGYRHLEAFILEEGMPIWLFNVDDHLLRRSVWMVPGHNITMVRYRLVVGRGPVDLAIRPLCAARDHHAVQRGNPNWHYAMQISPGTVKLQASPSAPPLWFLTNGATFVPGGDWYWNFLLREERSRGYDYIEDLYQPGTFHVTLDPGDTFTLLASAEDPSEGLPDPQAALAVSRATHRRSPFALPSGTPAWLAELSHALVDAADQFVVHRASAKTGLDSQVSLIAGYHWFTDYGRDAMISLPGLLLVPGRGQDAASLLRCFASYIDMGMLPNQFPDTGERPEYNTADATLWFFRAMRATLDAGIGNELLVELYPRLREIIIWHQHGTRYGIHVDNADGLLHAGEAVPGRLPTQLTWMDAHYGDEVYTPRVGKPVEINALWIEALHLMAEWAPRCDDDPAPYAHAAKCATASFAKRFWCEEGGYLFDVIDGPGGDDATLRPNQLVALASCCRLVSLQRARRAMKRIAADLLTPYGLRTLSPSHPAYVGRLLGDQPSRDRAYHQGTVWPWLLGPYVDALRRIGAGDKGVVELLAPFYAHLREAGVGCLSEVFDGDAPHTSRGAIHQAWTVAELLRIIKSLEAA